MTTGQTAVHILHAQGKTAPLLALALASIIEP